MVTTPEQVTQFSKALARLEEAVALKKTTINRDASIQRFEFTLDLAWKTIKLWLEDQRGVICKSPKTCIKEAYSQNLIDYDIQWVKMVDDRNAIAHMYKESLADALYQKLPGYLQLLHTLLKNLRQTD